MGVTIDSFDWDKSGWVERQRTPARVQWDNAVGDLMLQDFGPPGNTGLPAGWRDVDTLRAHTAATPNPQLAHVSVDVVSVAQGVAGVQYIHKERMPAPSLGMVYVGMLAMPFRRFFTRVVLIAPERGTTGIREATLLAAGKVPVPAGPPQQVSGDQFMAMLQSRPPPQRLPADDEEWDSAFPGHPLSRVRTYLREFRRTLWVTPAVRAEPAHSGGPAPA